MAVYTKDSQSYRRINSPIHMPSIGKFIRQATKRLFENVIGKSSSAIKNIVKYFVPTFLLLLNYTFSFSQTNHWILFKDKGNIHQFSDYQLLSPNALANRVRQGIELDIHDYPVNQSYRTQLKEQGIKEKRVSKWLNGISADLTETQIQAIKDFSFIREIRAVQAFSRITEVHMTCDTIEDVNEYTRQT